MKCLNEIFNLINSRKISLAGFGCWWMVPVIWGQMVHIRWVFRKYQKEACDMILLDRVLTIGFWVHANHLGLTWGARVVVCGEHYSSQKYLTQGDDRMASKTWVQNQWNVICDIPIILGEGLFLWIKFMRSVWLVGSCPMRWFHMVLGSSKVVAMH